MRIVHVSPTIFGPNGILGGGERYPLELCRALAPSVKCELVTFGRKPLVHREPGGLVVRVLRPLALLHGHPAHPFSVQLPAALDGADLVHTHQMRAAPSRIAGATARARDTRSAITDHGLQGDDPGSLLRGLFDRFLTVSEYSARELNAPPDRTRVIYGGADPRRYYPDPSMERRGVLFVGRITPHKGIDRLIAALPRGASLTIVGSGGHDPRPPESDYPSLLRGMAAGKDVRFLGPVSDHLLPALYRQAAVLVLPSVERTLYGKQIRVSELLGLVVLEAMASGTPVIASRVGGLPEVVRHGETGYLVAPDGHEELRDRLEELLGDAALVERMGQRSRELVLERFTWEACAERCLETYEELLKPHHARSEA